MAMPTYYEITVRGHLASHWSAWFESMTIRNEANGKAVLRGPLADQAALHGVLIKIRNLGLPLISICQIEPNAPAPEQRRAAGDQATSEDND
jgi:hypothetical protein